MRHLPKTLLFGAAVAIAALAVALPAEPSCAKPVKSPHYKGDCEASADLRPPR